MDMSRALDYPQSSTSELLRSLTRLGYLHYNRYRRTYSPKARLALLGAWVDPALFRGGAILEALDHVAELVGETVILSTAANYVLQHLHVVQGASEHAVTDHAGRDEPLLHCPEGRLILSSYRDMHIRSALHRLNAEEEDHERRVHISDAFQELMDLRKQGYVLQTEGRADGAGVLGILLPARRGIERLALSVVAPREVMEARWEEILKIMQDEREHILPQEVRPAAAPHVTRATISSDFEGLNCIADEAQDNHEPQSLVA